VFDTLDDEHGRTAHLEGQVSAALGEIAQTMPVIGTGDQRSQPAGRQGP